MGAGLRDCISCSAGRRADPPDTLHQGGDHAVQIPFQDVAQTIEGEADPVLETPLGIVVGADALGAIPGAHQVAAGTLLGGAVAFVPPPAGEREHRHRFGAVLVLGALVLALHHQPGGQVGDADGGVGLVDVLAAAPEARKVSIFSSEGLISTCSASGTSAARPRYRRRCAPALGFGLGDSLHPVATGFELEAAVDVLAVHLGDHLLVAAVFAVIAADDGDTPPLTLGVAGVHAEQIPSENGRLSPPAPARILQIAVVVILGVARQQHHQRLLLLLEGRLGERQFLLRHLPQLGILFLQHQPGGVEVLFGLAETLEG